MYRCVWHFSSQAAWNKEGFNAVCLSVGTCNKAVSRGLFVLYLFWKRKHWGTEHLTYQSNIPYPVENNI